MAMKNSAISNGLWNGLANAIGAITGVLGSILVVRDLTPKEYGEFSYYIWLAGILGILGTLSFPNAVTKITSELRGNGQDLKARFLAIRVALGTVTLNLFLTIGVTVFAFSQPMPQKFYLLLISCVLIPNGLAAVMRSTLWGKQTYQPVTLAMILASFLQLVLIIGAYVMKSGVSGYIEAMLSGIICQLVVLCVVRILALKNTHKTRKFPWNIQRMDVWKRYFAFAFPLTFQVVFEVIVWQRSEIFFLKRFSTIEQIGYYNLAYTFFGMFLSLGWALINGYYPALSHDYGARDWVRIRDKVKQGMLFACLFSFPVAFGGWATAPRLITLLYGQNMIPAIVVARVLFIGLIPGTLAAMASLTISALGGIWTNVRIGAVVALMDIIMAIFFIPNHGAFGASIANTTSQVLSTAIGIFVLYKVYKNQLPWKKIASLTAVSLAATLFIPIIVQEFVSGLTGLIIAVSGSILLYLSVVWRLGYLPFERFQQMTDSPT